MGKFLGHVRCPQCGYVYITARERVRIYFNFDAPEQLAEVLCEGCDQVIEGKIDLEDVIAFHHNGVELISLSERFSPLTEEEIDAWDIEEEIKLVIG